MKSVQFIIFAVVFIAGVVSSSLLELEDDDWENWKAYHGRSYSGHEEEVRRKEIWEENMVMIAKHNFKYQSGVHSYRLAMNQFGDLNPDEFLRLYTGLKRNITRKTVPDQPSTEDVTVPSSVDWREEGYVTPVKNQMSCGSCWAFSATGALEGQHFKKTGKLVSLSEQNLVDCSRKEGNFGCHGGFMQKAFQYVVDAGGIDTEESYPYEAMDGYCRFKTFDIGATCTGYTNVRYFSEKSLKKAVAKVGPISVAIDASASFRFYSHGIFSDSKCKKHSLNHGVLVVGYGSSSGQDYWIVKNSWSTSWGMEGYVLMSRNKNNQCGIATDASYPLV